MPPRDVDAPLEDGDLEDAVRDTRALELLPVLAADDGAGPIEDGAASGELGLAAVDTAALDEVGLLELLSHAVTTTQVNRASAVDDTRSR